MRPIRPAALLSPAEPSSRPVFEPLEHRLLYSADAGALVAPVADATTAAAIVQPLSVRAETTGQAVQQAPRELVLLDRRVPDSASLLADLTAQRDAGRALDILVVDGEDDPITAISDWLADADTLFDAIHLVGHGEAGELRLGASTIDAALVRARALELAQWSLALGADADLLLYGCEIAAGTAGAELLRALAQLTGADVAASVDATGGDLLGGDWDLEAVTGSIDTDLAFTTSLRDAWQAVLTATPQAPTIDTLVNDTTAGKQLTSTDHAGRQVATNTAGDTVVAWIDDDTDDVHIRLFDATGATVMTDTVVSASANPQSEPAVVIDDSRRIVVVWTEQNTDGSGAGVYGRVFDVGNGSITSKFLVNQNTADDQHLPSVALNPASSSFDFMVTWSSYVPVVGHGAYVRAFNWNATPAGSEYFVNSHLADDQLHSSIAFAGNGTGLVVWQIENQDGSGYGVYGRLISSNGSILGGEFRINTTTSGDQTLPDVGADAFGNFVVVWTTDVGGGDSLNVLAQRIDASGVKVGGEIQVAQTTNDKQSNPAVAVRASGDFLVTWQSKAQDHGPSYGVYLRHFGADGVARENEQLVNATIKGDQLAPSVAFNGAHAAVVWQGRSDDSTPPDPDGVFIRYYDVPMPGLLSWSYPPLEVSEGGATESVQFALRTAPIAEVQLALTVSDPSEGVVSAATLTFTPTNWNIPQTVVVSGRDDTVVDGVQSFDLNLSTTSSDADYQGIVGTKTFTNADNDTVNLVIVDTRSDVVDGDVSSLAALDGQRGGDGKISLREAILAANATPNVTGSPDRIEFNLGSNSPGAIDLANALPTITGAVVIDGTTHPGYADAPTVMLRYAGSGNYTALTLGAGSQGSTIRGLSIHGAFYHGIAVLSAGNVIELNRIGISPSSPTAGAISRDGINLSSNADGAVVRQNQIGNTLLESAIDIGGADGVLVQDNQIGVNGADALSIHTHGILVHDGASGAVITGNTIGGSQTAAIRLSGSATGAVVQGNFLGTDATGALDLGNSGIGIWIDNGASGNLIGGPSAGAGNLILHNDGRAIAVSSDSVAPLNNAILGNRIDDNGYGIDLLGAGETIAAAPVATANDTGDADAGPNGLQNTPVLLHARLVGAAIVLTGTLDSTPNTTFRIEFFTDPTPDLGDHGQAATMLSALSVTTDATGHVAFNLVLASPGLLAGTPITATATRYDTGSGVWGGTSEFAVNVYLNTPPVIDSPANFAIAENTMPLAQLSGSDADPGQTPSWSIVGGADMGVLTVDAGTGRVSLNTPYGASNGADFEAPQDVDGDNVYQIVVRLTDPAGDYAEQAIQITVVDANDAPAITSTGDWAIPEGALSVGAVSAADADVPAQTLTWSIAGGADSALFAIDSATGALTMLAAPDFETATDADVNGVYEVIVRVNDPHDGVDERTQFVTVTDVPEAPAITSPNKVFLPENVSAPIPAAATDPDGEDDTLTWSIAGGDDAAKFTIDPATGSLTLTTHDYENPRDTGADNHYQVTLRVTDRSGLTAELPVTVAVTDVNEAPSITTGGTITRAENQTGIATLAATDPDRPAQALTWSIDPSMDAARFVVDAATGALSFVTAPDFEQPSDTNTNNIYAVKVRVTDSGGLSGSRTFYVYVGDVNEPPRIQIPAPQTIDEDGVLTLSGAGGNAIDPSDPDATQGPLTVSLQMRNGVFTLASTDGLTFVEGDGTDDARATFTGSLTQLRAALTALRVAPTADFNGVTTLDIGISDATDPALADARSLAITVVAVDDPPALVNAGELEVEPGRTVVLTTAQLDASDPDSPRDQILYTVTEAGTQGVLLRDGVALATGERFSQAEVDAGRIAYRASPSAGLTDRVHLALGDGGSDGGEPLATELRVKMVNQSVVGTTSSTPPGGTGTNTTTTSPGSSTDAPATAPAVAPVAAPAPGGGAPTSPAGAATDPNARNGAGTAATPVAGPANERTGLFGAGGDRRGYEQQLIALSQVADPLLKPNDLTARRDGFVPTPFDRMLSTRSGEGAVSAAMRTTDFRQSLDRVREEIEHKITIKRNFVASTAAVSASLSIGYVIWLLRGGVLLSSLLASVPAWGSIDPLPVLSSATARRGKDGEDDSLQGMLKKSAHARGDGAAVGDAPGSASDNAPRALEDRSDSAAPAGAQPPAG